MTPDSHFLLAATLVGQSKGGLPSFRMLAVPLLSPFMSPVQASLFLVSVKLLLDTLRG